MCIITFNHSETKKSYKLFGTFTLSWSKFWQWRKVSNFNINSISQTKFCIIKAQILFWYIHCCSRRQSIHTNAHLSRINETWNIFMNKNWIIKGKDNSNLKVLVQQNFEILKFESPTVWPEFNEKWLSLLKCWLFLLVHSKTHNCLFLFSFIQNW